MIKALLSITSIFIVICLSAQQSTNFVFSEVQRDMYNPAMSAYKQEWNLTLGHRLLMNNYPGKPMSNLFSFSTNVKKKHGLGITISQQSRSVFKEFEGYLNYAYSARIGGNWKLGLGVSAGVKNQQLDLSNQVYFNTDDPYLVSQNFNSITYDARFGSFISSDKFLFHFSALQIVGQKYNSNLSRLTQNFISGFEYRFDLSNNLVLKPNASINYYLTGPMQYNIGAEFSFKNIVGIGAYYRSNNAISPALFFEYKGLRIGYAFDLIQMNQLDYGLGHEVYLKFGKTKFDSKINMISKELATEEVYELIDAYFDVLNSDLNIVEKRKLMNLIRNEIYELLPYMDDERRKEIEKSLKKNKK